MSTEKVNLFDYAIDENLLDEYSILIKDYCLINGKIYSDFTFI